MLRFFSSIDHPTHQAKNKNHHTRHHGVVVLLYETTSWSGGDHYHRRSIHNNVLFVTRIIIIIFPASHAPVGQPQPQQLRGVTPSVFFDECEY
jgi:hypothetical protein